MKKKISILIALFIISISTSIAFGQSAISWGSFQGTVAGVKVNGSLAIYDNGTANGSYGYNKYTKNNSDARLELRGTCRKTGKNTYKLSLTEYSTSGRVSGSWDVTYNTSTGRITGTMRNSKGKTYKVNCINYWD